MCIHNSTQHIVQPALHLAHRRHSNDLAHRSGVMEEGGDVDSVAAVIWQRSEIMRHMMVIYVFTHGVLYVEMLCACVYTEIRAARITHVCAGIVGGMRVWCEARKVYGHIGNRMKPYGNCSAIPKQRHHKMQTIIYKVLRCVDSG